MRFLLALTLCTVSATLGCRSGQRILAHAEHASPEGLGPSEPTVVRAAHGGSVMRQEGGGSQPNAPDSRPKGLFRQYVLGVDWFRLPLPYLVMHSLDQSPTQPVEPPAPGMIPLAPDLVEVELPALAPPEEPPAQPAPSEEPPAQPAPSEEPPAQPATAELPVSVPHAEAPELPTPVPPKEPEPEAVRTISHQQPAPRQRSLLSPAPRARLEPPAPPRDPQARAELPLRPVPAPAEPRPVYREVNVTELRQRIENVNAVLEGQE